MIKKLIGLVLFVTATFLIHYFNKPIPESKRILSPARPTRSVTERPVSLDSASKAIFVPYWSFDQTADFESYDRLFYFAVLAKHGSINKNDSGYLNLTKFVSMSGLKEKYLVLKISEEDLQTQIIDETIKTAADNGFEGIVLDLETSVLFSDKIPVQINAFVAKFYERSKEKNLKFTVAIFGDTFYRKRPYDINFLGKNSDEIIIMAYDFHKSRGEPGANFPLQGESYNFKIMINDFINVIPKEKLTVAYGLFGYDWLVDEQKRPIKPAQALTLNQIRKKFPGKKGETELSYIDPEGSHILWFEDENSLAEKNKYLNEKNIKKIAFWAYGYF